MRPIIMLVSLAALSLSALNAQPATVLHNATLIDGTGAPAREHVDIGMRSGLIESVGLAPMAKHPDDLVVDCTGKTIIPGLISAHSHLGVLENNAENTATAYNLPNITAALNQFEHYGGDFAADRPAPMPAPPTL
jgi:imidazolonepropionase-like amidohydrolase